MQFAVYNWRRFIQPYPMLLCNIYYWHWESDCLYITKSGYLWEFEVKVTRSDFFADAAKETKHRALLNGSGPARFYYVCPEGLITPDECPPHAGLLFATWNEKWKHWRARVVRESPRSKTNQIPERQWRELAYKAIDRFWSIREREDLLRERWETEKRKIEDKLDNVKCEGK